MAIRRLSPALLYEVLSSVLLFLIYFLAGKLGLSFSSIHPSASAVWPPTGIAIAAFLLYGHKIWPMIFLGAFVVNVTTAGSIFTSLGIALGNTLEGLLASLCIKKFAGGLKTFDEVGSVLRFFILAACLSTMVSPTIGVSSLALGGFASWNDFVDIWITWWLGDIGGALIVTPLIILWLQAPNQIWSLTLIAKIIASYAILIFAGLIVFGGIYRFPPGYPIEFLTLPFLFWISYRYRQNVAATATFILCVIAVYGTANGYGPYATIASGNSLQLLQIFIGASALTTLMFSASVRQSRRSNEVFRNLIENSFDGVVLIDELANFKYVSKSMKRILGYTPDEIMKFNGFDLMHPDDVKPTKQILLNILLYPQKPTQAVYRYKHKNGEWRWIEATGTNLLHNQDVNAIVVNFADITEKRVTDLELRKLSQVVVQSPITVMITDTHGSITYVNPKFTTLTGYTSEEVVGKNPRFLKSGAMSKELYEKMWKTISSGHQWRGEFYNRKKNGEIYYEDALISPITDAHGKTINYLAIKEDVTERKYLELSLSRIRNRLSIVMNSMAEGLIVLDNNLNISIINPAAEKMLGLPKGWGVGKDLTKIVTLFKNNNKLTGDERLSAKVLKTGDSIITTLNDDYIYESVFGRKFPVISSVAPIIDKDPIGVIIVFRDATELKVLDKAKSEFLSIAAHQLRTPLGITRWLLELLEHGDYGKLTDNVSEVIRKLQTNNQRLITLVGDLLNVTRIDQDKAANEPENIFIRAVIEEVIGDVKDISDKKEITFEFETNLNPEDKIFLDPVRFRVVIQNILSNAIKYCRTNGNIHFRAILKKNQLLVTCKDTGIGIPKESLHKIFTKFYRAPNAVRHDSEGSGLGLYMVKSYVEAWGGSLSLNSTVGVGTEVTVVIPYNK